LGVEVRCAAYSMQHTPALQRATYTCPVVRTPQCRAGPAPAPAQCRGQATLRTRAATCIRFVWQASAAAASLGGVHRQPRDRRWRGSRHSVRHSVLSPTANQNPKQSKAKQSAVALRGVAVVALAACALRCAAKG
jgi:hypothetical protein